MPYLLYPTDAIETTKPTYAVGHLDPVDEIILQDLRNWGWRIEETIQTDPKWLTTIRDYRLRMQGPSEEDGVTWPSLWEYWRDENARRVALEVGTMKKRGKLTKSLRPGTASSHRSSLSNLFRKKESQKLPTNGENAQGGVQDRREKHEASGPTQERKTIAQLRKETAQQKGKSEDRNTPNPARSLGQLDPNHSSIGKYVSKKATSAEIHAQLGREIAQEVVDWVGIGGILKTTQVSVTSEEGICIDDEGKQVFFPPKYQLPLFEWEEEVSRSSSTKSKDSRAKGSLECVPAVLSAVLDVADKYQEKDESDQKTDRIE